MRGHTFNLPYNRSKLYLKHILYNGCELYLPLADEQTRGIVKEKVERFNEYQKSIFETDPEAA